MGLRAGECSVQDSRWVCGTCYRNGTTHRVHIATALLLCGRGKLNGATWSADSGLTCFDCEARALQVRARLFDLGVQRSRWKASLVEFRKC